MKWCTVIFALLSINGALSQEYIFDEDSLAVQKGTVDVRVRSITLDEFNPRLEEFREIVSWHLSVYCKRNEANCWAEDKQIRRHDIVIQSVKTSIDDVNVHFHVRDRYDHSIAGMEDQQVRSAFEKVGIDIGDDFGNDVDLVHPEKEGMKPWLIAVITVCCVIGVALIITIIVLGCKQCEARGKRITREKLIEEELRKEYRMSASPPLDYNIATEVEGKQNPGYDSDSSDSSHDNEEPGTSRSNSTENSPPPDYNGFNTGRYNDAPPIPTKTALYDNTDL